MNTTLTEEQKQKRVGRFTASEIHKLMGVKGFGKTGETYIIEKAAEFLTGIPVKEEFTSAATQWGIDHEWEARLYFQSATGLEIKGSDTIELPEFNLAATPDGLIKDPACGFEIKCPYNSGNHLKNLQMKNAADLLDLRPEYYWQCICGMWLTGLTAWKFCSYDPRFPEGQKMIIINIDLVTAHMQLLTKRVGEAKLAFENILSNLNFNK